MPHPNDDSQNIRFAIFDCPEDITEEQKQEIRNFTEYVEMKEDLQKQKPPREHRDGPA